MGEIKWIKLSTDVFNNRKIRQIECMPDGDTIFVIWFKILALAGEINDSGQVYLTKEIPYTEHLLATQFNRPIATVRLALQTFQQFGMIEIIDNLILVSNWEKYQNIEGMERVREQTRLRVAKFRENKRLAECNATSNATSRYGNAGEEEKEEERDKEITPPIIPPTGGNAGEKDKDRLKARFNDFWSAYPRKTGKGDAEKEWMRLKPNAELFETILNALNAIKETAQWKREGGRFVPLPATWLNQRRWEDDPNAVRAGSSNVTHDNIPSTYNIDDFFDRAIERSYGGGKDG